MKTALVCAAATTLLCAALMACGGKPSDEAAAPAQGTVSPTRDKLIHLEATGALPDLDRSPSIEGTDVNSNGVRDDIERYIEQKYPIEAQRKAAMQKARALQATLTVNTSDQQALEVVSKDIFRSTSCARTVFTGPNGLQERGQMSQEIESMTTNTKERLKANLAYNKARSGSVSRLPNGDTCD